MESAVVAAIALLVLVGGAVALVARQGMLPWSPPALRSSGGVGTATNENGLEPAPDRDATGISPAPTLVSIADGSPSPLAARPAARWLNRRVQPPAPLRLDVVPSRDELFAARLERIEERLDELQQIVARQAADYRAEMTRIASELAARSDARDARQDAALEQLRADLLASVARVATDPQSATGSRRPEVSAELYARLARLEAGLAGVTNPELLPGESYTPPTELLAEALVWENWNEVGERAFALAEHFSAQRLHLSQETSAELAGFVTRLRTLLTRSVYPNLSPQPDRAQQEALRAALAAIAAELPRVRDLLEREYRSTGPG